MSTEQLYGMPVGSGNHAKPSRHRNKPRLPPVLSSSALSPAATQCEVAFPGNRILSPSPTDEIGRRTDYLGNDVCQTSLSDDAVHDIDDAHGNDEHSLRTIGHVSDKVSSQLASDLNGADTDIESERTTSLTVRPTDLANNCAIGENADKAKSAGGNGMYANNNSVPLVSMKAEKLATFGKCITIV